MIDTTAILLRVISSLAGAVLGLIFLAPKTVAEFWTRLVFSTLAGLLFGGGLREWLKWPDHLEMVVGSSALVALLSWFVMGAVVRIIKVWKPK